MRIPIRGAMALLAAANSAFPNGSRPGTVNSTSSDMSDSTVAVSPVLLADIQVFTRSRMACSSLHPTEFAAVAQVRDSTFGQNGLHGFIIRDEPKKQRN